MSIHSRQSKSNGTPEWQDDESILHSEFNDEWNAFLNDYNGNIGDVNIASAANIDPSKIGDHAPNNATFLGTGTSPGDSFSVTLPTDLEEEIEALRYRTKWNTYGTDLRAANAAGSIVTLGWTEPPITGRNLLNNPGFESQETGSVSTVDGWSLSGSPTLTIEAPFSLAAGKEKRSLNIVGNGVGIEQTVGGLKLFTKYRVGVAYVRTSNSVLISTSGARASGNYQNFSFSDSSTSVLAVRNFVVQTDGSGNDVTVTIQTSGAASAETNVYFVWFYEMTDSAPFEAPEIPASVKTLDTSTAISAGPGVSAVTFTDITALAHSVYVPGPGYKMVIDLYIPFVGLGVSSTAVHLAFFQCKLDGTVVAGPVAYSSALVIGGTAQEVWGVCNLKHVVSDLVPGTTHDVTFEAGNYNYAITLCSGPLAGGTQLLGRSIVRLERV